MPSGGNYGDNTGKSNCDPPPLPSYPTCAPPGSKMKADVMARRVGRGVQPNHPQDARYSDDAPGFPAKMAAHLARLDGEPGG
jgi:hypothetical protein